MNRKIEKPIFELRVALTAHDFERMEGFYRQGLGLEPFQPWPSDQGRALVLEMGRAVFELFDEKQANTVDQAEVGKRVSGPVRFALQVPDLDAAVKRLLAHGGKLVHEPVMTPWGIGTSESRTRKACRSHFSRLPNSPATEKAS